MKKLKLFGLACLAWFAINTTAMAEQKVMKIASWIPPHYQNTIIFPKWAEMVEKATEGRVTVKLEYGLGHPASLFDLVEDGIADATWSFLSYMPGRFEAYKFAELPLTNSSVDAGATSELLYNVVDKNFKTDGEVLGFEGLYLAGLWTHPTNVIFLRKPIDSLADLKNQKIGAQGTLMMTADAIGAISTQLGGADAYEKLQQGIADGSFFPHEVYKSLRLE